MSLTRKSLEDLWRSGKEYDLSPNNDGSAIVYVRKLGPTQQNEAVREANAERVKALLVANNTESDEYKVMVAEIAEIDRDSRIEQLAMADVAAEREKIEQELSEDDRWDDGKLQSLVDAWDGGMLEEWAKGEGVRSEESELVWKELNEFNETVGSRLQGRLERAKLDYVDCSDEELEQKLIKAQCSYNASLAWLRTFRIWQIYFSVHTQERKRFFESAEEVETLSADLFAKIVDAITDLNTPATEVKS